MAAMDDAAQQLRTVAVHLREAGDEGLKRELFAALRHATDPVPGEIRAGLKPKLPDRYAEVLDADLAIGTSVRSAGTVTLRGTTRGAVQRRRLRRLNAGVLAHPLWGNRRHWYDQPVTPGWFTGPAEDAVPQVREEILQALNDVAGKATSRGA